MSETDGLNDDRAGDVDEVEDAEKEGDLLPRPVAALQDHQEHDDGHDDDRQNGRDVKDAEGRRHADELGDQRQPVGQDQVEEGEPSPERAECVENRLCVAALGDRAQPHRHFLDEIGHGTQDDEEPQEAIAVPGARCRVRRDAARVVVGNHDDDARARHGQEDGEPFPPSAEDIIKAGNKADAIFLARWSCGRCRHVHLPGPALALRVVGSPPRGKGSQPL